MFNRLVSWWYATNTPKTPQEKSTALQAPPFVDKDTATPTGELPNTVVGNSDSLSKLQQTLLTEEEKCTALEDYWKERKIELLASESVLRPEKKKLTAGVRTTLELIFGEIKSLVEPADWNIESLNKRFEPIFEELEKDLKQLSEKQKEISDKEKAHGLATETALLSDEKRDNLLAICDESMEIIEEMKELLNYIIHEIEFCLGTKNIAEKLVESLVVILLKFPLPGIDLGAELYNRVLFSEIAKPIATTEGIITKAEASLEKAKLVVESASNNTTNTPQKDKGEIDKRSKNPPYAGLFAPVINLVTKPEAPVPGLSKTPQLS